MRIPDLPIEPPPTSREAERAQSLYDRYLELMEEAKIIKYQLEEEFGYSI